VQAVEHLGSRAEALGSGLKSLGDRVALRPILALTIGFLFICVPVLIGSIAETPQLKIRIAADEEISLLTVRESEAFDSALQSRLGGQKLYKNYDIVLVYELKSKGIFKISHLMEVAKFERRLRALPGWDSLCSQAGEEFQSLCQDGLSLANFVMPTHLHLDSSTSFTIVPTALKFDGKGTEQLPFASINQFLRRYNLTSVLMPQAANGESQSAESLRSFRSVFRFRRVCCTSDDTDQAQVQSIDRMNKEWLKFVADTLFPALRKPQPPDTDLDQWPVQVWFAADTNDVELEVEHEMLADIHLAIGGASPIVFLYLLFHTKSIFASLAGVSFLAFSPMLGYCIFRLWTASPALNVVTVALLFPAVGLGVETLLLYFHAWQESMELTGSYRECINLTWEAAASSTFWAALISVFAFLGVLPAGSTDLRLLSAFVCPMILLQWAIITAFFVPILALDEHYFRQLRLRRCLGSNMSFGHPAARRLLGDKWVALIGRRWKECFAAIALLTIVLGALAMVYIKIEETIPQTLPVQHNMNAGRQAMAQFAAPSAVLEAKYAPPPVQQAVCKEEMFSSDQSLSSSGDTCGLMWCEATLKESAQQKANDCVCYRKWLDDCIKHNTNLTNKSLKATQRFVGFSNSDMELGGALQQTNGKWQMPFKPTEPLLQKPNLQTVQPMVLQEWESGKISLQPVVDVHSIIPAKHGSCSWRELCYCSSSTCLQPPIGWSTSKSVLPTEAALKARSDGDQTVEMHAPGKSAGSRRSSVYAVVGLDANYNMGDNALTTEVGGLWSFSSGYNPADLWAQRHQHALCYQLPKNLGITKKHCWLEDFKLWVVRDRKGRYPVPENGFHRLALEFMKETDSAKYMWVRDGKVMAWYAEFEVDVPQNASEYQLALYRRKWENYFTDWRSKASVFAKGDGKGVWHTSPLWTGLQEPPTALSGLTTTVGLVSLAVFLILAVGIVHFAGRSKLLLLGCASIGLLPTTFGFLFCQAVLYDEALGFVETVAFVVVMAHAASYVFLVILCYHRTGDDHPICSMGSVVAAALGSSIVAAGCSVFLKLCFLPVFKNIGAVTLVGVPVAAIFSLSFLPAAIELLFELTGQTSPPPKPPPHAAGSSSLPASGSWPASGLDSRQPRLSAHGIEDTGAGLGPAHDVS